MTDEAAAHRVHAVATNYLVWDLLGAESRTPDDDQRMVHAAHASAHHWRLAGESLHQARAEWLISRVYAVLGRAEAARHHAARSLAICEDHGIGDFDLAYAYEAVARAEAAAGEVAAATEWRRRAAEAGNAIANPEDKEIFDGDFAAGPWFGADGLVS